MKKKVISLLISATMMVGMLAGCGSSSSTASSAAEPAESSAAESVAESTAEAAASTEEATAAESTAAEAGSSLEDSQQADEDFYAQADMSILKGKKIGITIQSLQNAYWAGVMKALQEQLDADGAEYTIVACDDNSEKQISQVENFISSKCDLIMIHPSDANAVEDVAKEAEDAGIKVMCWDDPMTNTSANWVLDNTILGEEIGKLAGGFITEHYTKDNKAQVAVIGYPQTKVLLERANGIKAGLKESADGYYDIVAEQAGIEANKAQTAMETILQKYPDCKVVAGVGAGAMIGANEALTTAVNGKVPEDMGVFTTDVTKQQLTQLISGDQASKGIIGFEGSDVDTAKACASMYALILGDKLEHRNIIRQIAPITKENAEKIMSEMK